MRATVRHTLSARFVEIEEASVEEFEHRGVAVRVDALVRESHSFATVVCSGTVEVLNAANEPNDTSHYLPLLSGDGRLFDHESGAGRAWRTIESVLQDVGAVIRWRFGMFGDDPLWTSTEVIVEVDGRAIELFPMPTVAMGDDMARIEQHGLHQVADLVGTSVTQPLAHEMWREAWNLKHTSPRSSLVMGVAAAEVGIKQLIALLAPSAKTLVEYIPSPPLDTLIRKVLPSLPIRSGIAEGRICPRHLRKGLIAAVEARNVVVHRGEGPGLDLRAALLDIRDFLYLLDHHAGHSWAETLLSERTRDTLHST